MARGVSTHEHDHPVVGGLEGRHRGAAGVATVPTLPVGAVEGGGAAMGRNASAVRISACFRSIRTTVPWTRGVGVHVPRRAVRVCLARVSGEAPLQPLMSRIRARLTSNTEMGRERTT